jgi:hypothetical protein
MLTRTWQINEKEYQIRVCDNKEHFIPAATKEMDEYFCRRDGLAWSSSGMLIMTMLTACTSRKGCHDTLNRKADLTFFEFKRFAHTQEIICMHTAISIGV